MLRAEALFASPAFHFTLPEAETLNPRLLAAIEARRAAEPGISRSNRHGWHSADDLFRRPEPAFQDLCKALAAAVVAATRQVAPDYVLAGRRMDAEGWVNINGQHAFNTPHDHPGWAWSGCYYAQVPAGSGDFEFLDVRTNANVIGIEGAACFDSKRRVRPEAGLLLLFPSYLPHWVYPNEAAEERVSIAFNARFTPVNL